MPKTLKRRITKLLPGAAVLFFLAIMSAGLVYYAPRNEKIAPATAHASGIPLTGWAWSDNIGWVSFSSVTSGDSVSYGVSVNNDGTLTGYAWSPSIGWINFGANSCNATPTLSGGILTGSAQAIDTGSDGCISLGGTAANSAPYSVYLSGTAFNGWAWASDTIGWLSFNCATGGPSGNNICATSNYAVLYGGSPSPTCSLTASPNPVATYPTGGAVNLNWTTTNSPTSGTLYNYDNSVFTAGPTLPTGGYGPVAPPSSAGSYTYSMTVNSPSGSYTCTAPETVETDVCQNISGIQNPSWSDPNGYTSGGNCYCNSGYVLGGSGGTQCVASSPSINSFSGPARVRSGETATLTYSITSPSSCSITGTNGYNSGAITTTSGSVTTTGYPITANTLFTLSCTGTSKTWDVGIDPTVIEK